MSDREITMHEFRQRAEAIVNAVSRGERLVLTYRGKRALRLVPIGDSNLPSHDDGFYSLASLGASDAGGPSNDSPLTNEDIDHIVYEP